MLLMTLSVGNARIPEKYGVKEKEENTMNWETGNR